MKNKILGTLILGVSVISLASCGDNSKIIKVCASDTPHAIILNECVKDILKSKGYKLEVTVQNWQLQNSETEVGAYDANYFQHTNFLDSYKTPNPIVPACKVHYEPLSIYHGNNTTSKLTDNNLTFEICNDTTNAIRAFNLLKYLDVLTEIPVSQDGKSLTFAGDTWNSGATKNITVTLISEEMLSQSLLDYNFGILPANTALTGNVSSYLKVAKEEDPTLVTKMANIIAVRKNDYLNNETYKNKIDVLTDAMLSSNVATFIQNRFDGAITCDSLTQIDLRSAIQ